jgi:nitrate reductase gamma subunit
VPLLIRRLALQRVREVSNPPDYFALLLVLAVIFTGDIMRFGPHVDLEGTRQWARSLVTFSPLVPANFSAAFLVHTGLALGLIMYMPFSKILHFGGIFFTQALVKRS